MALLPSGCLIHFEGECGPLTNFTEVSYQKFLVCREIWLTLDGVQRIIAEKTMHVTAEDCTTFEHLAYHRTCYSKFTNKTLIQRAKERVQKRPTRLLTAETVDDETNDDDGDEVPAPKLLRSMAPKLTDEVKPKNAHVLPAVCIICNKKESYFTDRVNINISSTTFYHN